MIGFCPPGLRDKKERGIDSGIKSGKSTGRTDVPDGTDSRPFKAFSTVHRTVEIAVGNRL